MVDEDNVRLKIHFSHWENRFSWKLTMNRIFGFVLLLYNFTMICGQDYEEDDQEMTYQNNSDKSNTSLIAELLPQQNYRKNETGLTDSKPKMKNPPKKIISLNDILLLFLVIFGNLFLLILVTCLIISNHKTVERRIRMKIKYKPSQNSVHPQSETELGIPED